jgi:hypothetical protein
MVAFICDHLLSFQRSGSAAAIRLPLKRFLADRFFATLSEAIEYVYATIRRGQSDQGSSLFPTQLQSHAGTSPVSPRIR